jgi:hypothetical protein
VTKVRYFINNGTLRSSYSQFSSAKYATEWVLARGTTNWVVLNEKRTHPNTDIEWSKWDFGPFSAIPCQNCVVAVAYVRRKCSLKVKLLIVTKRTRASTGDKRDISIVVAK